MEYNNFYPNQPGIQPNHQHGGPQQQPQGPPQMMHGPGGPVQNNMRHMHQQPQPGHQQHHQHPQMQPHPQMQQLIAQNSQQQPNYQQNHGSQIPHSSSPLSRPQSIPHGVPQQHPQQHNQQPPPQHMHHQQPMHGGLPIHVQPQHQQSQQVNHQARPPITINHPHAQQTSQQQHHQHHPQNFFPNQGPGAGPGGPPPPQAQSNIHYIPHQNQNHSQHQGPPQPPPSHHNHLQQSHPHHHHNHHPQHPQGPMMHHHSIPSQIGPPPPSHIHHQHQPHHLQNNMNINIQNNNQGFGGRNSPCYQPMLQTEARIMEINRRLQMRPIHIVRPLPSNHDDHQWWDRFALEFFDDDATLTIRNLDVKPTTFTIGRILIPRFFKTYFDGGATDFFINIRNSRETLVMNNVLLLNCDACMVANTRWRATEVNPGAVVHSEGQLSIEFLTNYDSLLIKSWKFYTRECKEFLDRESIHRFGLEAMNAESLTKSGLSKPTALFLNMCKVIEPMQDLMSHYKTLDLSPKECLRRYLEDKYKFRVEETRVPTNKRRKRKPSAAPIAGAGTNNKRTKVSVASNNAMNNSGMMGNNNMMCPSRATQNFTLTPDDVMTVGEPSMMGGDFGDANERMITRLENSQYEPSGQTPMNPEESDSMTNITTIDENNGLSTNNNSNSMDHLNDTMSSSISQDQPQQQQQQHFQKQQQLDQHEPVEDHLQHHLQQQQQQQQQQDNQQRQQQNHLDQQVQSQPHSSDIVQPEVLSGKSQLPPSEEDNKQDAIGSNRFTSYDTTLTSPLAVIKQEIEKIAQETNQVIYSQSELVGVEQSSNNHNSINEDTNSNDNTNNNNNTNDNNDSNSNINQNNIVNECHGTIEQANHIKLEEPAESERLVGQTEPVIQHDVQRISNNVESTNVPEKDNDPSEDVKIEGNSIKIEQLPEPQQDHQGQQQQGQTSDVNPIQQLENHTNSIQPLNEESDSNSQLTCSNTPAPSAMEQQQPVDNGVA